MNRGMDDTVLRARLRIKIFVVIMIVAFLVILVRLWYLQVILHDVYDQMSKENRTRILPLDAPRGLIRDRNGAILADSRTAYAVSFIPQNIDDIAGVIDRLSEILGMDKEEIEKKIAEQRSRPYAPVRIKTDVSTDVVISIRERKLELPGIIIEDIYIRNYPYRNLASLLLGYIGPATSTDVKRLAREDYREGDLVGKTGIEYAYEAELKGVDGTKEVEVDAYSWTIKTVGSSPVIPGNDVVLTIDVGLQDVVEKALLEQIEYMRSQTEFKAAEAGAVVVMDVNTGDILAIVSKPDYDPNIFVKGISSADWQKLITDPNAPLFNRSVKGQYSPGSAFKLITAITALETGEASEQERFHDSGRDPVISSFKCWILDTTGGGHGNIGIVDAIAKSCNIVFYELGRRVGPTQLAEFARMFGFGAATGINAELGESGGLVPDEKWKRAVRKTQWMPGDTLNVSIGQGDLLVTPLQLARAYAAFANGGTLVRPRIVSKILSSTGEVLQEYPVENDGVVKISNRTRDIVVKGLIGTTSSGGTAYSAFQGFPITVAGKTGTMQVGSGDNNASFVCFAPAYKPEIVIVVVVEQGGSGARVAPVARKILEYYFGIEQKE